MEYVDTPSTGSGITLWAKYSEKEDVLPSVVLGGDALGEPKKSPQVTGKEAAAKLIENMESSATVDEHLADNLIPFMALSPPSALRTSSITNHAKTNIYVCQLFLKTVFEITDSLISSKLS